MQETIKNILTSNSCGKTYNWYFSTPLWLIHNNLRVRKDSKAWGKLEKMKEVYGEKAGTVIHIISYTIVPIAVGIAGIVAYCLGIKVF